MKYVKSIHSLALGVCLFGLLSCGGAPVKTNLTDESVPRDMVSTLEFIPVAPRDKEGVQLPYEAQVNPYLQLRGKIKKESALKFIEAKRAVNSKNTTKANSILDDLITSDDSLSGPWVVKGDLAQKANDLDLAAQNYARAIEVNSKNVNAYTRLALVQRQQGKFLLAQNSYAEALKVWKDYPEAHLNLAILYDLYLNHPIRAQKHMEAFQFLTGEENVEVAQWLEEIRRRTGIVTTLKPLVASNGSATSESPVAN